MLISVAWCFNNLHFLCYNIGLPNTFGEYDESPEVTASHLKVVSFVFFGQCVCIAFFSVLILSYPYLQRPKILMWKDISRYQLNMFKDILNQKKYSYFLLFFFLSSAESDNASVNVQNEHGREKKLYKFSIQYFYID